MPCYYPLESVELNIKRPYGFLCGLRAGGLKANCGLLAGRLKPYVAAARGLKANMRLYGFQSRLRPSMPSNFVCRSAESAMPWSVPKATSGSCPCLGSMMA